MTQLNPYEALTRSTFSPLPRSHSKLTGGRVRVRHLWIFATDAASCQIIQNLLEAVMPMTPQRINLHQSEGLVGIDAVLRSAKGWALGCENSLPGSAYLFPIKTRVPFSLCLYAVCTYEIHSNITAVLCRGSNSTHPRLACVSIVPASY